jgi:microcystin-dependent protein
MSNPFVGEIRLFGFNFVPLDWLPCDGSLVAISEYETLFNLIGTTYGGDGQTTFGLPDLRGRVPIHQGTGPGLSTYVIGQQAGIETVTLTPNQLPQHTHPLPTSSAAAVSTNPTNAVLAAGSSDPVFTDPTAPLVDMSAAAAGAVGGSQPHDNMMPTLTINYAIAAFGIFPSRP